MPGEARGVFDAEGLYGCGCGWGWDWAVAGGEVGGAGVVLEGKGGGAVLGLLLGGGGGGEGGLPLCWGGGLLGCGGALGWDHARGCG